MHVHVDEPWPRRQAAAVIAHCSRRFELRADGHNPSAIDEDVALHRPARHGKDRLTDEQPWWWHD
jgi:hypothetical protein